MASVGPASMVADVDAELARGSDLERRLRWAEAEAAYAALLARLPTPSREEDHAARARVLLREGNVLMELGRWDDARRTLDDALFAAKAAGRPETVAEALLAAGVYASNRRDTARAEAFFLDALERYHRSVEPAFARGRGWSFLNLASLYGTTGRLDLAFVTFTKAQDVLGAAQDWAGVAAAWEGQAQLRRAIGDEDRWREDLAEAVVFYDREGMTEKANRLRALLGRKLV